MSKLYLLIIILIIFLIYLSFSCYETFATLPPGQLSTTELSTIYGIDISNSVISRDFKNMQHIKGTGAVLGIDDVSNNYLRWGDRLTLIGGYGESPYINFWDSSLNRNLYLMGKPDGLYTDKGFESRDGMACGGCDFALGKGSCNNTDRGNCGRCRALVKMTGPGGGSKLILNYAVDFVGGTEIHGPLKILKHRYIDSTLSGDYASSKEAPGQLCIDDVCITKENLTKLKSLGV